MKPFLVIFNKYIARLLASLIALLYTEICATIETAFSKEGLAFEKADVDDDAYCNGKIASRAITDLKRLKKMNKSFVLAVGLKKTSAI